MTAAIEERPAAFEGIYEAPEAARYLTATLGASLPAGFSISSGKVLRWIRSGLSSPELIDVPGRELLLTFQDLVSMRIIAALRAAGVSFPKIRTAERWLRQETGHQRPFATEMLWTERSDVFVQMKQQYIAASRFGQMAFNMLEQYLIPVHGLTFDERRLAASWEPRRCILLDPLVQFGSPCIKGTRIPTRTLWGMVEAGDSVEYISGSFEIPLDLVCNAVEWERALVEEGRTAYIPD